MRKILITGVAFLIVGSFTSMSHAQNVLSANSEASSEFFETLPDVPKMYGMMEREDLTFIFDKPEGRITETLAHLDNLSSDQIRSYYSDTLPQLGWRKNAQDEFIRDTEKLSLQFEDEFLKITIEPR